MVRSPRSLSRTVDERTASSKVVCDSSSRSDCFMRHLVESEALSVLGVWDKDVALSGLARY